MTTTDTKDRPIVHNQLQIKLLDKLRKGMNDREWGPSEMARRSGVPQSTVSHILSGYRQGSLGNWDKLMLALEAK